MIDITFFLYFVVDFGYYWPFHTLRVEISWKKIYPQIQSVHVVWINYRENVISNVNADSEAMKRACESQLPKMARPIWEAFPVFCFRFFPRLIL